MGQVRSKRWSIPSRWSVVVLAVLTVGNAPGLAQDPGGPEVLARGPIHEAFAAPVAFNPTLGAVVPKPPPTSQIEEQPPDQKPQGANVDWIPGYWAWDDERNDFLWISGIWRDIPPGRQWVPGYWGQVEGGGGFRWTSGFWAPAAVNGQLNYLPAPPPSLEVGPNVPQPAPDWFWSPGSWAWAENRYVWRPGYWVQSQPEWIWVPPAYAATPSGYVYIDGYWDYPVARRGLPYAPVYFSPGYVVQPTFAYTPTVALSIGGITANLFIRPSSGAYYFGNYYPAPGAVAVGYVPWFAYQQRRFGYDPLYASMAAQNWRNPRWSETIRTEYVYRVEHVEARPASTFAAQRLQVERARAAGREGRGLELAHPANRPAAHGEEPRRMVAVPPEQRAEIARRQVAVQEVTQSRARVESAARVPNQGGNENHQPHQLEIPRTPHPAASEPVARNRELLRPPTHPEAHQQFRPTMPGQPHREPAVGSPHGDPHRGQPAPRPAHSEPKARENEHHKPH